MLSSGHTIGFASIKEKPISKMAFWLEFDRKRFTLHPNMVLFAAQYIEKSSFN
jgi:hypothetical protein